MPRRARLLKRPQFQAIYNSGHRVAGKLLVMFIAPQLPAAAREASEARMGVTTTRRIGTAVTRNRARRVVRAAFRRHRELFRGYDLVINVRAAKSFTTSALERELIDLWKRSARERAHDDREA